MSCHGRTCTRGPMMKLAGVRGVDAVPERIFSLEVFGTILRYALAVAKNSNTCSGVTGTGDKYYSVAMAWIGEDPETAARHAVSDMGGGAEYRPCEEMCYSCACPGEAEA
mmetsp:Transcript_35688/g.100482  ORF Transcript_35688/g.100482 Transcript_35688/m.100482 type:complete len:110 (-) Transcript_35688:1244-1573(-)